MEQNLIEIMPVPAMLVQQKTHMIKQSNLKARQILGFEYKKGTVVSTDQFIRAEDIRLGEFEHITIKTLIGKEITTHLSVQKFNVDELLVSFWQEAAGLSVVNPEQKAVTPDNLDALFSITQLNHSTDSIFIIQEGIICCTNENLRNVAGYKIEDLAGHHFIDFVAPDQRTAILDIFERRAKGLPTPAKYQSEAILKNGQLIDVEVFVLEITYQNKAAHLIVLHDTLEKKRVESKYQNIIELAPVGFYQTTEEGRFLSVNSELASMLGFADKYELLTQNIRSFYASADVRQKLIELYDTPPSPSVKNVELQFRKKDGTIMWVLMTARAIKDHNGHTLFYDGFLIDITTRKQAEMELNIKEHAITSSINAIGIADLQGKMVYINEAALRLWQYSQTEVIGAPLAKFWHGDGLQKTLQEVQEQGFSVGEDTGIKKDGTLFTVQYTVNLVRNTQGEPINIFGSFMDISEQKKIQKIEALILKLSKKSLVSLDLKAYLADIHNELRKIIKADNFYVALYDKSIDKYTFPYHVDEMEDYQTDLPVALPKSLTDYVRKTAKGLLVTEATERELNKTGEVGLTGEPSPVWLGVPLIDSETDEVIGVLALQDYYNEKTYSHEDLTTLEVIAYNIGLFIEKVKNLQTLKETKLAAEEGERRYRSLFYDNKSVMLLIEPFSGNILDVNKSACTFYGYSYEELTNMKIQQINTLSGEQIEVEMQKAFLDQRKHFQFKHRLASGKVIDVEVYSGKVTIDGRDLLYSIVHDVSKRREAEEKVAMLTASIEQSPVITMITDTQNNIEYVNSTFCAITGYSASEILGLKGSLLKAEDTNSVIHKEIGQAILSGENWVGEQQWRKKNGELFRVQSINIPIKDENGNITHIASTNEDITERKKHEEEIARLYKAIDQSYSPVAMTDLEGHFIYVNNQFCRLSGYSRSELLQANPRLLKSGRQSKLFYKDLWDTITSGQTWKGEITNKKKSGELYLEAVSISPIVNEQGKITHYIKVSSDITQERKIQDELIRAKEKAEESDRLKTAFLANMSHEIRTPMNGIMGFTDLLREPDLTSDEKDWFIGLIHQSGERLLNTVNDIIEVSRIESGTLTVNKSVVDAHIVLEQLLAFFLPEAQKKALTLTLKQPDHLPFKEIITDKGKLESILSNLIKNAIKYTGQGNIQVVCEQHQDKIQVCISDTGIGIPENRIKAIFNRFEQADIADVKALQGSGLGLTIAKSYTELLGGSIWVESTVDVGSTFCFSLPVKQQEKAAVVPAPQAKASAKVSSMRNVELLVVEDDDVSAFYLELTLKPLVGTIVRASSGEEAIAMLKAKPSFDIVLMDIKMPGISGYEATRQIRTFNEQVYIIAQTAFALTYDKNKALEAGCNDYLPKPIRKPDLLKKLEKALGELKIGD